MYRKLSLSSPESRRFRKFGLVLLTAVAVRAAWAEGFVVLPFPKLVPNARALDRGCRTGGPGGINAILPEWVSVQPADTPAIAEGVVRRSQVATNDAPNSHLSHDQNFDVALDFTYGGLHSDANEVENNERLMEIEWETKFFPPEFWPMPGDRVWMMGRWIFDCGHPPYRTEFHPPVAVAFTHPEPTTFTGDAVPTLTNRCSVYIHGRGGYYDAPVAVRNYEFDMPLPPRPSRFFQAHAEVVSLPFGGPRPVLTVVGDKVHVLYPLAAINNPSPDLKFGAVIAAGWRPTLLRSTLTFRVLRVTFDSIRINNDHDPDPPFFNNSGEWRLWVRAGSHWLEVRGLTDVDSGETVPINRSVVLTVPASGAVWGIQTTGWEDDCDGRFGPKIRGPSLGDLECKLNGNDDIGFIAHDYTAAENFGIGSHNAISNRNGDADTQGDFNLRFHVDQIAVINPSPTNSPVIGGQRAPTAQ